MDLKKYVDRRKFSVFVMVSEWPNRGETGQRRIFWDFEEMGMKRNVTRRAKMDQLGELLIFQESEKTKKT